MSLIFEYPPEITTMVNTGKQCLKKHYKNEWYLNLVIHIFSKLSQNVCLINIHFLICISNQYGYVKMSDVSASYGMPLLFITFFANFAQN